MNKTKYKCVWNYPNPYLLEDLSFKVKSLSCEKCEQTTVHQLLFVIPEGTTTGLASRKGWCCSKCGLAKQPRNRQVYRLHKKCPYPKGSEQWLRWMLKRILKFNQRPNNSGIRPGVIQHILAVKKCS
jgi:hypothetical protein